MTIPQRPEQFKPRPPALRPFSDVTAHECLGEVRPYGDGFFAVAVIGGFPIWLGTYVHRWEACEAVLEAHGCDV